MPDDIEKKQASHKQPLDKSLSNASLMAIEAEPASEDAERNDESIAVSDAIPTAVAQAQQHHASKRKKQFIIAGFIALISVLLVGGCIAAYAWYTNPNKVVLDSLINAASSKSVSLAGTAHYDSGETSVDMTFSGKGKKEGSGSTIVTVKIKPGEDMPDLTFGVEASTTVSNATTYAKLTGVKDAYTKGMTAMIDRQVAESKVGGYTPTDADKKQLKSLYDTFFLPLVNELDNQWIKITADDLKSINEGDSKQYQCIQDAYKKIIADTDLKGTVYSAYQKHSFLKVKQLSQGEGNSIAYDISLDKSAFAAFEKELGDASSDIKTLYDCPSGDTTKSSIDDIETTTDSYTIWVDQWSHVMTKVSYDGSGKYDTTTYMASGSVTPTFNMDLSITPPSSAKSLKDITSDLKNAYEGVFGSSDDTDDATRVSTSSLSI